MKRTLIKRGRTAPFVFSAGLLVNPAVVQPLSHWRFVDDGTGIELRTCRTGAATLCAVVTRLAGTAMALPLAERKALCGVTMPGDLRPASTRVGEPTQLDGWVDDIESMTPEGKPPRYAASLIVLSENRARLDVRLAFGIVAHRYQLVRTSAPSPICE